MSQNISFFHPASLISTCFGVGRSPFAPGTMGTVLGVFLLVIIAFMPSWGYFDKSLLWWVLAICTVIFSVAGWWSSDVYSRLTGREDPSEVIIDEVAGMFLTATLVSGGFALLMMYDFERFSRLLAISAYYLIACFLLFRFFDIVKPWHVGVVEKKYGGGFGIMADDLVAAVYAAISFYIIFFLLLLSGMLKKLFYLFYPHLAAFV